MHVCPECASTLCVPLCGPGERPVFIRCMLCGTVFLAQKEHGTTPKLLGAQPGSDGHQVKVRVTTAGFLDDPLGVAKAWAREIARTGDPVPVGVGMIAEQPTGNTEVTLLLMIGGVTNPSAAEGTAIRRCAVLKRLDPRVRDIRPAAVIPTAPREYSRVPEPVSPHA